MSPSCLLEGPVVEHSELLGSCRTRTGLRNLLTPTQPFHRRKAFKEDIVRKHGPSALEKLCVHATCAGSALLTEPRTIKNLSAGGTYHHNPTGTTPRDRNATGSLGETEAVFSELHGIALRWLIFFFGRVAPFCAAVVCFSFRFLRHGRIRGIERAEQQRGPRVLGHGGDPSILSSSAKRRSNEGDAGYHTSLTSRPQGIRRHCCSVFVLRFVD